MSFNFLLNVKHAHAHTHTRKKGAHISVLHTPFKTRHGAPASMVYLVPILRWTPQPRVVRRTAVSNHHEAPSDDMDGDEGTFAYEQFLDVIKFAF